MKANYKPKALTLSERERSKAYRSRRESTMAKIQETDDVCACQSFMVSLRLDNGASFYCGSPVMVTRFFARGVARSCLSTRVNVRMVRVRRSSFCCPIVVE